VLPPGLDQDLGRGQAAEDLAVEQFVTELAVEALALAILPRTAERDVGGLRADCGDPFVQNHGNELRAVV
jgi:hypothetical protein